MSRTGPVDAPRGPSGRALAALLVGAFLAAAGTTLLFFVMRAVMDIGGSCAEGGPYVPVQPCPEGAALAMPLGMVGWMGGGALLFIGGASVGGAWAVAGILAWSALFGSLGWNFIEYGLAPPGGGGTEWGWLIPGIVFEAMAIVPLVALVPLRRALSRGGATTTGTTATPDADTVANTLQAAGAWLPPPDDDLVSRLERLTALHAAGSLTDAEFASAKETLIDDAREDR